MNRIICASFLYKSNEVEVNILMNNALENVANQNAIHHFEWLIKMHDEFQLKRTTA